MRESGWDVVGVMRKPTTGVVLLGALLAGCMAAPEAEELVIAELEEAELPELRSIPEGERMPAAAEEGEAMEDEPEPPAQEAAARSSARAPRFTLEVDEDGCPTVSAVGFPAISADGETVVAPQTEHFQLTYVPGHMDLEWHDADTGAIVRREEVVLDEDVARDDDMGCSPSNTLRLRRRLRQRNRELAEHRWRTMERLPIELFYPETHMIEVFKELPVADRRVQLLVQHGEIVVRIVGVKVLERSQLALHMQSMAYQVFADRETGAVVLVTMDCVGEDCTCDPAFTSQVLHWQPETFEALDRRPCEDDESGYCDAIDFGFNGDGVAWSI